MKILNNIQQNTDEWLAWREGKITGSKLGKLFAKSRKAGELYDTDKRNLQFYQILAERLTTGGSQDGIDEVSAREWGHIHEPEAIAYAAKRLGIDRQDIATDSVWQDGEWFGESPDAYHNSEKPEWFIEAKCLSSANHLKAAIEDQYPEEYQAQIINYFLTCPSLTTGYVVLYDPRFANPDLQLRIWVVSRDVLAEQIERMRQVRDEAKRQLQELEKKLNAGVDSRLRGNDNRGSGDDNKGDGNDERGRQ